MISLTVSLANEVMPNTNVLLDIMDKFYNFELYSLYKAGSFME